MSGVGFGKAGFGAPGPAGRGGRAGGGGAARGALDMVNEAIRLEHAAEYGRAEIVLSAAAQLYPRHPEVLYQHGWVLANMGRERDAVVVLKKAASIDPRRAETWHELGGAYQALGMPKESVDCFERAMFLNPKRVETYCACAVMLERDRKADRARSVLQKGLQKNPGDPQLRMLLAAADTREGKAPEAETVLREIAASAPNDEVRCRALHNLANALEEQKRHVEAWSSFRESNALRRTFVSVKNALKLSDDVVFGTARSYEGITQERFAAWKAASGRGAFTDDLPDPAFLVGFPRSGTTMTENALGAHPNVVSLDEPPTVTLLEHEARRVLDPTRPPATPHAPERWAEILDAMSVDQWRWLRAFYWSQVKEEAGPDGDAARVKRDGITVLDKNPFNIYRVGLLNRLFPMARVVCVIRDPRDVCISCFTQFFRANPAMVLFTEISDTARAYAAVMSQWITLRDRFSMGVLEVRYEDTVNDFDNYARRLVEFMGLEWNDAVLEFQKKAAAKFVSTPSFRAVTQSVNTRAVGRWSRYEGALDAVMPVLAPFIKQFGYD
ncbi:MAG: tetratricopeptide repeat-containing sulfotransferase family protein [Phycisphaerales bacterium]